MLRLAQKAFYPGPIPFPLLHIDTGFKFREMIAFRDDMARSIGADLLVWRNEFAIAAGLAGIEPPRRDQSPETPSTKTR